MKRNWNLAWRTGGQEVLGILILLLLVAYTTFATPLQWTCDWPEAKSQTFSLYQGETATFEPTFRVNGRTVTNATIEAVWYQTNGMGNAWWKLDGATFAPSNDVGAASYRFFVEARSPTPTENSNTILYRANGALRMLPSPGFTPNAIEPPVTALDFSTVEVSNAPWLLPDATNATLSAAKDYADDTSAQALASASQNATNYTNWVIEHYDPPTVDLSPDNEELVETIQAVAPEPDLTGYATTHETETAIRAATNNLVSAVELPGEVYRIVAGTNIVDVVTNYDSAVHAPARYLQQIATNGTWKTIWAETNGLARTLAAAKSETTAATNALAQVKADRAWSRHTSALGADAPEGTTWISTPTTVIAGGYEYARTVTSSGQYWFLTSNGLTLEQGATNSYLNVSALDGTPIFRVEKTDSQLVGVRATEISMVGSVAIVSVPVVGAHPYARVAANLVNATWYKEDGDGMPQGSPATVAWSGSSGAWVATVDFGNSTQGFCYFEFLQEGVTKIVNNGVTELSGGIIFNGVKYMPTVNGNKLEFVAQ